MLLTQKRTELNCEIKSITNYGAFVEIAPGREGLCHVSELSSNYIAKPEDAFKVGDRFDVKLIEVNEKGQLRLSRRALLLDAENSSDSEDSAASQEATDKGSPKKVVTEQSKDKAGATKGRSSSKSNLSENTIQKKFIRKLVGPSKDLLKTNKEKEKKSSSKPLSSISSKDGNSLVNGEANNIGQTLSFLLIDEQQIHLSSWSGMAEEQLPY